MEPLTVVRKELSPEYKSQDWWWKNIFKKPVLLYAKMVWKYRPLLLYPLVIEIELGLMRYYFYKDGLIGVKRRIDAYHYIVKQRLQGYHVDLDPDEYHRIDILTDEDDIERQLDKEAKNIY